MPRYLLDALNSDPAWNRAVLMADSLKTPALKAAYMQALEAVGENKLARMLDVAYQEKMRYFAKRIAVTELHREYDLIQEAEYLADEWLEYVQWRMSQTHERSDICDLYARQDKYGLGPGCYPKELAPRAPAHPFCRCVKSPRLDLTGSKVRFKPGADRAYLKTLPVDEAARVAGSKSKLRAALKGEDVGEPEYQRALLKSAKSGATVNSMNDAYEIAKSGGRHGGWYENQINRTERELDKGIQSFEKQISMHEKWIADPTTKMKSFHSEREDRKQALLAGWRQDIDRHKEFIVILQGILRSKGHG